MKKILILGGTNFIGRNLVEQLLETAEYDITLFNRQLTNPNLYSSLNKIKGDRESEDIKQIEGQHWDYVIDLSCYYPNALNKVLSHINDVEKYIFISTCSVYDNEKNKTLLRSEESKTLSCSNDQKTDTSAETYGNRKAECERILKNSGLPHVILRPALVFGEYDPTDRFYYWLYQIQKSNILLLPENGKRLFSTTYVSDLVEAIIRSLQSKNAKSDVYNVITNPKTSIRQIIDLSGQFINNDNSILNAPADFLRQNNITQWIDLPLWINSDHFTYSDQKMRTELGMETTRFKIAIEKTIKHYRRLNWPIPKYGITESRKKELIKILVA